MLEVLQAITPEILIVALASWMYLAGTFLRVPSRRWYWGSIATLGVAAVALVVCGGRAQVDHDVVVVDSLAVYAKMLALLTGLVLVVLSEGMSLDEFAPEYFASLLVVVAGSMLVAGAQDLILLFLGLELIGIPTYVLLYLPRRDAAGQEAAAKYFYLSVFSSAVFLYGLSLLYGATGATNLTAVAAAARQWSDPLPATVLVALPLIVAGLGFKVAAFPFHFYAPDVYQGTTDTLAALLSWVPKAAGFVVLLRVVTVSLPELAGKTAWLAFVLAALTMTIGNTLGLLQNNLRRLLAYSGIAHSGYMMVGIGVGIEGGTRYLAVSGGQSVVFYLLAYAAMTLGVFSVIVYLSSVERRVETVDDFAGLARSHPYVALLMALFLFSLTGIPITAGFWGKLAIFSSALATGDRRYVWLAVIGVINAAISSYYYLRIIGAMYMQESYTPVVPRPGRSALWVAVGCAAVTIGVGFVPGPFLSWSRSAVPALVADISARDPAWSTASGGR